MLVNAKIKKAGLYYDGHFNCCSVGVELKTRGGGAIIRFPVEKTTEFMDMFDEELDLENGVFINDLEGVPVVLKLDGDTEFQSKIVAIGSILASEGEMMPV